MGRTLMTIDEYSEEANRTKNHDLRLDTSMLYNALKLSEEAGEISGHLGKFIGQGHKLDFEKIAYELGDLLWHLNALSNDVGYSLNEVARMNIEKLRRRYPDGFSVERSISRSD